MATSFALQRLLTKTLSVPVSVSSMQSGNSSLDVQAYGMVGAMLATIGIAFSLYKPLQNFGTNSIQNRS
jgi:hypothetical protein